MDALISKIIYFALTVILLAAVWKSVKAYLSGNKVKSEVKQFLVICIFLGAAPGLVTIAHGLGESIVKPAEAIVNYVSESVSNDLDKSLKQ